MEKSSVAEKARTKGGEALAKNAMIEKMSYVEILNTMGLARILGRGWGQFATVPDPEIEAIERTLQAQVTVVSHPYLREGQRVRVTHGPSMGVEGILVSIKPKRGL